MGAISEGTLVVTSVHNCPIVEDIPSAELMKNVVSVNVMGIPTRVIRVLAQ
jgi:hypothetical protein